MQIGIRLVRTPNDNLLVTNCHKQYLLLSVNFLSCVIALEIHLSLIR